MIGYTYEIYDLILVGSVLGVAVGYLAIKGDLFRGW